MISTRERDPIGRRLNEVIDGSPRIIVGVVGNGITTRLRELGSAAIYYPMKSAASAALLLRTHGPPEHLIQPVRSALYTLDSRVRLDIAPVSAALEEQLAEPRMLAALASLLAAIAVTLAVVGIYGVTSFVVGQRRQEISVRLAVGASFNDIRRLLVHDSLRPVVIGLSGGLVVALLASRAFIGVLYGLSPLDPASFLSALLLLFAAALCAVIVPSRRAASVDPASLLREQ